MEGRPAETAVVIAGTALAVVEDIIGNNRVVAIIVAADTVAPEIVKGDIKATTPASNATITVVASTGQAAIARGLRILRATTATTVRGVQNVPSVMKVLTLPAQAVPGWK